MPITKNNRSSQSPISRAGDTKNSNVNRKFVIVFAAIIALGIPMFISYFLISSNDASPFNIVQRVHIVFKKDGKKYIFHDNAFFLENDLQNGNAPSNFGLNQNLLLLENEFYMDPLGIQGVAALLSDNYTIIPHEENNYDGYVILKDPRFFEFKTQSKAGDKIGNVNYFYDVILRKDNSSSDSLLISWQQTPVQKAIKNCEEKEIMLFHNPYQGKTVGNYTNSVVVNLKTISNFYQQSNIQLTFDETEQILYVIL